MAARYAIIYLALFCQAIRTAIVINEVMHDAKQGSDYEYVELYNNGTSVVDISSWSFSKGITFTFPAGSTISANDYVVVVGDRIAFLSAYGNYVDSSKIFGPYTGKLDNIGENVELSNSAGVSVHGFKYSNTWTPLSNAVGSSLELKCHSADPKLKSSWAASPAPIDTDKLTEFGGSPGRANSWTACPPSVLSVPNILVTEIMFQPYKEQHRVDRHEFIEFLNGEEFLVDLSGYRLVSSNSRTDGLRFTFPANSVVPAQSYFLVVKDKAAFLAVYNVSSVPVFGDYQGELKNGGDEVYLVDTNGLVVTEVAYDDKFPWPAAARNMGTVQYKGHSLERVSLAVLPTKTYNWIAQPNPTPGRKNIADAPSISYPTVTELAVAQFGNITEFLGPLTQTVVTVKVSPNDTYTGVQIRFFIDDIEAENEQTTTGQFTKAGDNIWKYTFAGFPGNTIVRFVILVASNGQPTRQISPRSNDPYTTHNFFISPASSKDSATPDYHIFIQTSRWSQLWYNLNNATPGGIYDDGVQGCCFPNLKWNAEEQAVLAYKGQVYDVAARYQGSAYNRFRGSSFDSWFNPPAHPNPLLALSWKIKLPDYIKIDSKSELFFIKQRDEGCSFITAHATYALSRQLGLFSPIPRFARIFVNGQYYNYAQDQEYYSSDLIEKYIEDVYDVQCKDQTSEQVGILYKANGFGECSGPIGSSSESYQWPVTCPNKVYSTLERTQEAYSLDTHKSWAGHEEIVMLSDILGGGPNSMDFSDPMPAESKAWLEQTFDVNLMLNYLVLVNWAGAWDDLTTNHMLYKRLTDGKWHMAVWDTDNYFGREPPCLGKPSCSLYLGEYGQEVGQWQVNGSGNSLKDAFIKAFRPQLQERYRLLSKSVLSVANVNAAFDAAAAAISVPDILASQTGKWDPNCVAGLKSWHAQRHAFVQHA
eukprot:TRINITY_DN6818_c0_g1_i3.p1 TRINITY_DN6818_c0_g1~~TRINITY_DN6818_c0_g1_i3.p1  ORF type:complete len:928 (-),score=208.89 TRINITY_DN6818_c0_g1_i3:125-2908(-)